MKCCDQHKRQVAYQSGEDLITNKNLEERKATRFGCHFPISDEPAASPSVSWRIPRSPVNYDNGESWEVLVVEGGGEGGKTVGGGERGGGGGRRRRWC